MSPAKELRFFDTYPRWEKGPQWYARYFRRGRSYRYRGEATPTYLSSPAAPGRIAQVLPGVRLIAILREPAARAYSEYNHVLGWGAQLPPFEAIVNQCGGMPSAEDDPFLWKSRYLPQLKAYADAFPRDQLLVILFEDLQRDPGATFARICAFLDLESWLPANLGTVYNKSRRLRSPVARQFMEVVWTFFPEPLMEWLDRLNSVPVNYPKLSPQVARRVADMFAEENAELASWLELDLSTWDITEDSLPA